MTKLKSAEPAVLDELRTPASLRILMLLDENGWLTADAPAVDSFFKQDPIHPARKLLMKEARFGGAAGYLQVGVLLAVAVLALLQVSLEHKMTPAQFVLWGVLGVTGALILRQHPGFADFLRKRDKRC
jgi:hypothetical protein